jgi:DNA-binding CsgD family transcriptional regulator
VIVLDAPVTGLATSPIAPRGYLDAYAHGIALEADRVAVVMDARRAARADGPAHAVERERAGAVAVADDLYARMLVARDRLAARGTVLLPEPAAWFVTAQAEHARAHQRDEPAHWEAAAKAWAAVGQPVRLATAQLRQAEALVRRPGSRTEAAALLREAVDAADGIGARPLAAEIRALARRARLDIGAEPAAQVAAVPAVTPRELEVLRLLAQGRTNRQIGETLFISEKTASVHVTNLLRKLGVSSRVEAAAFAVRTGVADAAG